MRPVNATAAKGGDVSLPCLANSISSYTWTKDGKSINITAEPRMSLKDGSLQIKDLADEDAGDYVCIVRIQDRDVRSSSPAALQVYGCCQLRFLKDNRFVVPLFCFSSADGRVVVTNNFGI